MLFENIPVSAVLYARVSSDDQRERQTIRGQIEFAKKYCDLHNIKLEHIYEDDGVTENFGRKPTVSTVG